MSADENACGWGRESDFTTVLVADNADKRGHADNADKIR